MTDNVKRYVALQQMNHNNIAIKNGDVIELSDSQAVFLLKAGYVQLATDADSDKVVIGGKAAGKTASVVDALQVELADKTQQLSNLTTERKSTKPKN